MPAKGKSFDPSRIPKAVKDAGFTPGEIGVTATGTFARENDLLRLKMVGPVQQFVLAGGAKVEELNSRSDLLGKRVRVTGKLHPSHADRPPGLTVEKFERLGDEGKLEKPQDGKGLTVRGKLTDEGVECPALRGDDGKLYTLLGDLKGHRPGDTVCVRARVAEISYCMQGTTLSVEHIDRTCP